MGVLLINPDNMNNLCEFLTNISTGNLWNATIVGGATRATDCFPRGDEPLSISLPINN